MKSPPAGITLPSRLFFINTTTKITRNGQIVPLSALLIGDKCRAEVLQRENVWVAVNVQATSAVITPILTWAIAAKSTL